MSTLSTRVGGLTLIVFLACAAGMTVSFAVQAQEAAPVTWINLVNATATGSDLEKTSGCDGCSDAGATSLETITAGDGYVEVTIGETDTFWLAGLSHGNTDTSFADIDFAFRFNGAGWADVLENGVYQAGDDMPYSVGDVFRVAIVNGRVQYSRNGQFRSESQKVPVYPLLLDTSLGSVGATVKAARLALTEPPPTDGWLIEKVGSPALRARFTPSEIADFLPAGGAKGAFTFPAPYNTEAVRLTDATDCVSGQDCLWGVGYSYWRNINNHTKSSSMLILLGTDPDHGGHGPTLLRYNKLTSRVENLGPLFPSSSPYSLSTGEGWYFSGTMPTRIYTFLVGHAELRRYDVLSHRFDKQAALDLDDCTRPSICPAGAAYIYQPHSSDDDDVHMATVQNAAFERLGCVVYRTKARRFQFFATSAGYGLDECQVDKSGRWLVLLETRPNGALDNRIVDLRSGAVTTITDAEGALGHFDMGFGYAVGADNYNQLPNATILLKLPVTRTERPVGPVVHANKRWDIAAANHVAHGNAISGAPPESQFACGSNASRVADMADEIVCFSLDPGRNVDQSLDVLVVGQVMTDLDAPGGRDDDRSDYRQVPKGNLDVTGRYFIWTANLGGDRLDAFLVKIPSEALTGAAEATPAPKANPKRKGRR